MKNTTTRQLLDFVAKFSQSLPLDLDRTEVQKAIEDPNHHFWKYIRRNFTRKGDVFVFEMNYGLSFRQLYEELFPEKDNRSIRIEPSLLWEIDKTTQVETIERHLVKLKAKDTHRASSEFDCGTYESATLKELMVFGANNPEIQCSRRICILGQSIRAFGGGYPLCQLTKDSGGERVIHIPYTDKPDCEISDCWFLVKKLKP